MNFTKPDNAGETMTLSKIGQRRQVTIPKIIFDEMKFQEGDFVEVTKVGDDELLLKKKLVVDATRGKAANAVLPPGPSYEERMRLLKLLEGNATDDSGDIDVDFIEASRTTKELTISFDE